MGYANSNLVNQVSSALATIGQQVGELRNEIGLTSHGKINFDMGFDAVNISLKLRPSPIFLNNGF
jgi:hypothetical protein